MEKCIFCIKKLYFSRKNCERGQNTSKFNHICFKSLSAQDTFGLSGGFRLEKNWKSQNLTLSNMTQNCIKIMFRVWKRWKKQLLLIFHQFWDKNCILKKKVGKILKKHEKCWISEIFDQKYTEKFKILLCPILSENA